MDEEVIGIVSIVAASAVALLAAFGLRTRLPAAAVTGLLAVAGGALGAGALLVQDDPGRADWWVTLIGLAVLVPIHVRVVLGPLGASRGPSAPG